MTCSATTGRSPAQLFHVTDEGTFEEGASTLQLLADPVDVARYERWKVTLLAARATRPQPARDDKVITSWNGLAIAGLAEAGMLLDRRYLDAARAAATLVARDASGGRPAARAARAMVSSAPRSAVAEDYGNLAFGLLALHQATGEPQWLSEAGQLLDFALEHFGDGAGGFYDTGDDAEQLVRRPKDPTDNAYPSGTTALANALVGYAALTGSRWSTAPPPKRRSGSSASSVLANRASSAGAWPRPKGWSPDPSRWRSSANPTAVRSRPRPGGIVHRVPCW